MKKYDAFISYAIEDKQTVAAEIAKGLRANGLSVYFVGDELGPGDSVSETVYEGLENSAYLVPVLSRHYVRRWTTIEWNKILREEKKSGRRMIFPVWHAITEDQVKQLFPDLHDRFGKSTEEGIGTVVASLVAELKKQKEEDARQLKAQKEKIAGRRWLRTAAVLVVLALLLFVVYMRIDGWQKEESVLPSIEETNEIIRSRIESLQFDIDDELHQKQSSPGASPIPLDSVMKVYSYYNDISENSRNDYYFFDGYLGITGHDRIEAEGIMLAQSPHEAYGVSSPVVWCVDRNVTQTTFYFVAAFVDTAGTGFSVDTVFYDAHHHEVHARVSYTHYLRCVYYTLNYSAEDDKIRQHTRLLGFKPKEEYIIVNQSGLWKFQKVE